MNNSVLVIEENIHVRENAAELLELAGYNVFTAKNGKDGLTSALKTKPDLILCDTMMPELDGYGVFQAIENLPDMIGTPFVFITAKSKKMDIRKGMDLGADDYLVKPFGGDDLLKVVSARLKKNQVLKTKYKNNHEELNDFVDSTKTFQNLNILSENRTIKKIRKKDFVFMEGDSSKFLYFIVSGKVKTYKTNELGKEYITEIHGEGDFFGYLALLDENKYKESAVAIENTEVALVPQEDFFQLLYSNKEVSSKFIKLISHKLVRAEEKLVKLAYNSARKRVAEALIFIFNKYQSGSNNEFTFPTQRENISAIAGISPESVSRNLTDFKEEGLIEASNGTIKILNFKKLAELKN